QLQPLRDRPEDIPALARLFVDEASLELHRSISGIEEDAMRVLQGYAWPGNVRELRNIMRRAVLQAQQVMIRQEDVVTLLAKAADSAPPQSVAARAIATDHAAGR